MRRTPRRPIRHSRQRRPAIDTAPQLLLSAGRRSRALIRGPSHHGHRFTGGFSVRTGISVGALMTARFLPSSGRRGDLPPLSPATHARRPGRDVGGCGSEQTQLAASSGCFSPIHRFVFVSLCHGSRRIRGRPTTEWSAARRPFLTRGVTPTQRGWDFQPHPSRVPSASLCHVATSEAMSESACSICFTAPSSRFDKSQRSAPLHTMSSSRVYAR